MIFMSLEPTTNEKYRAIDARREADMATQGQIQTQKKPAAQFKEALREAITTPSWIREYEVYVDKAIRTREIVLEPEEWLMRRNVKPVV